MWRCGRGYGGGLCGCCGCRCGTDEWLRGFARADRRSRLTHPTRFTAQKDHTGTLCQAHQGVLCDAFMDFRNFLDRCHGTPLFITPVLRRLRWLRLLRALFSFQSLGGGGMVVVGYLTGNKVGTFAQGVIAAHPPENSTVIRVRERFLRVRVRIPGITTRGYYCCCCGCCGGRPRYRDTARIDRLIMLDVDNTIKRVNIRNGIPIIQGR